MSEVVRIQPPPALSAIIPAFNCSGFLADALNSFLSVKDKSDIEIIVVDDGSDDKPGLVVTRFKKKGLNLRLLTLKENQGLSSARNHGLAVSTGKFVLFVDCDDAVEAGWLAWILPEMERLSLDVLVVGERKLGPLNSEASGNNHSPKKLTGTVFRGDEFLFESLMKSSWKPSACLQIVRRQALVDGGILFERGLAYEDILYSLDLQRRAARLATCPAKFYLRRETYPSISRGPKHIIHLKSLILIYSALVKHKSSRATKSVDNRLNNWLVEQELKRIVIQKMCVVYKELDAASKLTAQCQPGLPDAGWPHVLIRLIEFSPLLAQTALYSRRLWSGFSRKTLWPTVALVRGFRKKTSR